HSNWAKASASFLRSVTRSPGFIHVPEDTPRLCRRLRPFLAFFIDLKTAQGAFAATRTDQGRYTCDHLDSDRSAASASATFRAFASIRVISSSGVRVSSLDFALGFTALRS